MPARKKQASDTPSTRNGARSKTKKAAPPAAKKAVAAKTTVRSVPDPDRTSGGQNLVIVESPSKAKTINRYLGPGFKVLASMGHVRDLPKRKKPGQVVAGVDIDKGWKATYEVIDEKKKNTLAELKKEAARSNLIYLATDPDREGEAIAWHLEEALKLDPDRTFRITFNEITRSAVQNALQHPTRVDLDRVRAQEARRILDRIVGFPLSGLLSKKLKPNSSAGRVQSVALRLVVEREREIEAFKPEEYWKITALLAVAGSLRFQPVPFKVVKAKSKGGEESEQNKEKQAETRPEHPEGTFFAELAEWNGKKFELGHPDAGSEQAATAVAALLDRAKYRISKVEQKDRQEKAPPPFITSTLQQQASTRLHFSSDRTMKTAQKLYEGVPLGGEGSVALITYMRTDSTRISDDALKAVRAHIQTQYGQAYLPDQPNVFASGKSAQEAHEAIRPTDLSYTPERVAQLGLHGDQLRLYTLIYNRFVACQMAPAVWAVTNVEIQATPTPEASSASNFTALFKTQGRILKFDGFRKVLSHSSKTEDATLPPLKNGQSLDKLELTASQHYTQPPPRYNEASLIKVLEKEGIGRPSTYATIISKITSEERGYIEVKDRRFYATEFGKRAVDLLVQYFPAVMDLKFTSHFEEELDDIENHKIKYQDVLDEFWGPFSGALKAAEAATINRGVETGEKCPQCGRPLMLKFSRKTGKDFVGCSGWKEGCKYIKPAEGEAPRPEPVQTDIPCPVCGKPMLQRTGKTGPFLGCSAYPECKATMNLDAEGKPVPAARPTEHKCDKCGRPMMLREGRRGPFLGCTGYPKCKNIVDVDKEGNPVKPVDTGLRCEKCNSPMVVKMSWRGPFLGCSGYPKCRATKPMTAELKEKLKDQIPAPAPKKEGPKVTITETCPDCGSPMKLRQGRGGNYFLGCSKYPKCKGTREVSPELLEQIADTNVLA